MKDDPDVIRTPKGAKLGRRVCFGDKIVLEYKVGKIVDYLDVKSIVECITGLKVKEIVFETVSNNHQTNR